MSLGLRESRRSRRRQAHWALLKGIVLVAALGLIAGFAYFAGSGAAANRAASLQGQISKLSDELAAAQTLVQSERAASASAHKSAEEWQARYQRDIASGATREIVDLVQTKLQHGVPADRLRSIIGAVEKRQQCEGEPAAKRYLVPTAGSRVSALPFARGALLVSVVGEAAQSPSGSREPWFDAASPVTVKLTRPGGSTSEFNGILPVHAAQVIGDYEYRFSIVPAVRGYVDVAMERCRYP
jgi:hypothetical protein